MSADASRGTPPGDRRAGGAGQHVPAQRALLTNPLARRGTLALWDAGCWALATAVVLGVRLDFTVNDIQWRSTLRYLLISMVCWWRSAT